VPTIVVTPSAFDTREAWTDVLLANINHFKPELVVLAGFMRILPANFVAALSPNLINLHPSLLPAFPGAHAVRDALYAGAKTTGATIHIVDEGVDTGPHIAQVEVEVLPDDNETELHERIKAAERKLLIATVKEIAAGKINLHQLKG
jgi:phosphoribosylglycinamide formyltransferase-1